MCVHLDFTSVLKSFASSFMFAVNLLVSDLTSSLKSFNSNLIYLVINIAVDSNLNSKQKNCSPNTSKMADSNMVDNVNYVIHKLQIPLLMTNTTITARYRLSTTYNKKYHCCRLVVAHVCSSGPRVSIISPVLTTSSLFSLLDSGTITEQYLLGLFTWRPLLVTVFGRGVSLCSSHPLASCSLGFLL